MSDPAISVKINVVNLMNVAENLVAFRKTLENGGVNSHMADLMAGMILQKAIDAGNTTVGLDIMNDRKAFLDEAKKEISDYAIDRVARYLSETGLTR